MCVLVYRRTATGIVLFPAPQARNVVDTHEPELLAFGTAWPNTIGRLREHLQILRSIFDAGSVDFHGDDLSANPAWPVTVAGGQPVPLYVAAMGPKALQVTGETGRRHTALPHRAARYRLVHQTHDRES